MKLKIGDLIEMQDGSLQEVIDIQGENFSTKPATDEQKELHKEGKLKGVIKL